jgi:sulfur-oxidizing protein SoxY
MNRKRRQVVQSGGSLAALALVTSAGWVPTAQAQAWNKAAFEGKGINDVVKAMGGVTAAQSAEIAINAPDIAENGAVVPVGVSSKLGKTESIAILVEKNPNALAASFDIPAGTEANVTTRVKMGQSSNVHAVVKADGKFYVATKEVKVTLGGCGG